MEAITSLFLKFSLLEFSYKWLTCAGPIFCEERGGVTKLSQCTYACVAYAIMLKTARDNLFYVSLHNC